MKHQKTLQNTDANGATKNVLDIKFWGNVPGVEWSGVERRGLTRGEGPLIKARILQNEK